MDHQNAYGVEAGPLATQVVRPILFGVMPLESASTLRAPGTYPPVRAISFRYLEVKVPPSTRLQNRQGQLDGCRLRLVALGGH
jgi:hypothetical protein